VTYYLPRGWWYLFLRWPRGWLPEVVKEVQIVAKCGVKDTERLGILLRLSMMAGAKGIHPDLHDAGTNVRELLERRIDGLYRPIWCVSTVLRPFQFQVAMKISLGFKDADGYKLSVKERSQYTAQFLRLPYSYETWRKYRMVMFEAFARQMLEVHFAK